MARYGLNNRLFKSIVATKEERIPWSNYGWDRNLVNTNKLLEVYWSRRVNWHNQRSW